MQNEHKFECNYKHFIAQSYLIDESRKYKFTLSALGSKILPFQQHCRRLVAQHEDNEGTSQFKCQDSLISRMIREVELREREMIRPCLSQLVQGYKRVYQQGGGSQSDWQALGSQHPQDSQLPPIEAKDIQQHKYAAIYWEIIQSANTQTSNDRILILRELVTNLHPMYGSQLLTTYSHPNNHGCIEVTTNLFDSYDCWVQENEKVRICPVVTATNVEQVFKRQQEFVQKVDRISKIIEVRYSLLSVKRRLEHPRNEHLRTATISKFVRDILEGLLKYQALTSENYPALTPYNITYNTKSNSFNLRFQPILLRAMDFQTTTIAAIPTLAEILTDSYNYSQLSLMCKLFSQEQQQQSNLIHLLLNVQYLKLYNQTHSQFINQVRQSSKFCLRFLTMSCQGSLCKIPEELLAEIELSNRRRYVQNLYQLDAVLGYSSTVTDQTSVLLYATYLKSQMLYKCLEELKKSRSTKLSSSILCLVLYRYMLHLLLLALNKSPSPNSQFELLCQIREQIYAILLMNGKDRQSLGNYHQYILPLIMYEQYLRNYFQGHYRNNPSKQYHNNFDLRLIDFKFYETVLQNQIMALSLKWQSCASARQLDKLVAMIRRVQQSNLEWVHYYLLPNLNDVQLSEIQNLNDVQLSEIQKMSETVDIYTI